MTKASLYVYVGPVAVLVCRRFGLSPFWFVAVFTIPTSQQSSEVYAAAAVADSDAPEVVAAGTGA